MPSCEDCSDDGPFDIVLPLRRSSVREADYFPRVYGCYLNAREWPDNDVVELARDDPGVRAGAASEMRRALWSVRNHRVLAVSTVYGAVRRYAACESLLERAGVSPLVTAVYCDFYMCRCNCNGACAFGGVDLLDVDEWPERLCDHVRLRAREICETQFSSLQMIAAALRR